jgi:predicted nucleic acid-binding protein
LILETTFLVDLEREARRKRPGGAHELLQRESGSSMYLTFTVAGELAAGTSLDDRDRWESFLRPFRVLESSSDVCWQYGELYRLLSRTGALIGTNDLWIAATARAYGQRLVTRNEAHFSRIPDLELVPYSGRAS